MQQWMPRVLVVVLGLFLIGMAGGCDDSASSIETDTVSLDDTQGDVVVSSCSDDTRNGEETDTDCGGTCGACGEGSACLVAADCLTGVCADGLCAAAGCGMECSTETRPAPTAVALVGPVETALRACSPATV
ncbi:MAG: hypothetical protein AUK47_02035 [Deltaproteobacteria bacterium CG2_30_63_29]|nr:MAG: hypothetical protein AUK47_02035 [Deltaproteobacteria bacterium CG2_30_63_29]PJB45472.1 MAG: hypothetical protein CO108_07320 [Deltaproteobacteria bacterium CG_4_9_14_3_um_filter_63_12]